LKWDEVKNSLSFQYNPHPALSLSKGEGFGRFGIINIRLSFSILHILASLLSLGEGEDEGEGDKFDIKA